MHKPSAAELAALVAAGKAEEFQVAARGVRLKGGDSFLLTSNGQVYHDHVVVKYLAPGTYVVREDTSGFAKLANKLKEVAKVVLVARAGPLGDLVGKLVGADGIKVLDAVAAVHKGEDAVSAVGLAFGNEKLTAFGEALAKARDPNSPGGAKITAAEYAGALAAFAAKA